MQYYIDSSMRPITYRLRVFAALLGIAQGAVPALAIAHEVAASELAAPIAHVESQGANHDVATHSHECGICRHGVSKDGFAPGAPLGLSDYSDLRFSAWDERVRVVHLDGGSVALPRGPPLG